MMGAQFTLTQQYSEAKEEQVADNFKKKIATIISNGHLSLAISLGLELNLFDALAKAGSSVEPATALDVARIADLKARYCQEWLSCMSCGDIIEVDQTGMQFWISEERLATLSSSDSDHFLAMSGCLPMYAGAFKEVAKAFKKDGPLGVNYSVYKDFYAKMNTFSRALHQKHLVKDFIPMINMYGQLSNGIEVLDVGCGAGFHMNELASHFPNSRFVGIDIGAEGIRQAQHEAHEKHLHNVCFISANAAELDASWTDKFDLVTIFDACHDQTRPDLAVMEVHRCLKPGGLFAMVEVNSTGNCYNDKHKLGSELATFGYAASLFHCLPVGSNSDDALQLGAMWGVEEGQMLLESVGFKSVTVEEIPFFELNVLYKGIK